MLRDANDYARAECETEPDIAPHCATKIRGDDITIEGRARDIVQQLAMPEIRQIWPHAYREAITAVAQILAPVRI